MKQNSSTLLVKFLKFIRNLEITLLVTGYYIYWWPDFYFEEYPEKFLTEYPYIMKPVFVGFPTFFEPNVPITEIRVRLFVYFWSGLSILFFLRNPFLKWLDRQLIGIPIRLQLAYFLLIPTMSIEFCFLMIKGMH